MKSLQNVILRNVTLLQIVTLHTVTIRTLSFGSQFGNINKSKGKYYKQYLNGYEKGWVLNLMLILSYPLFLKAIRFLCNTYTY